MDFVVNEWLPEYFLPTATVEEKLQLQTFLNRFMETSDRIVVRRPSAFASKIERYAKEYQNRDEIVRPIRDFIKLIWMDSNRCLFIDDDEFEELPAEVNAKLSEGNYVSDEYLFEAASVIEADKIIVTTDIKLKKQFADNDWCNVELLADFLDTY